MLKFVTKKDYWFALDQQEADSAAPRRFSDRIRKKLQTEMPWHLKSIQDSIARYHLRDSRALVIGEIGGGNSRVLQELSRLNSCFNIDEFRGSGGGPTKQRRIRGITNVYTNVGDFSDKLQSEQFDVLFSISVVEHVENLDDFFKDSFRILKNGGKMIHLIDIYLEDSSAGNRASRNRVRDYIEAISGGGFSPYDVDEVLPDSEVTFSTAFATNPDNVMRIWNNVAPSLKSKRELAQSCSLLMITVKNE
jgi:SAM-dependent methyltransferase